MKALLSENQADFYGCSMQHHALLKLGRADRSSCS